MANSSQKLKKISARPAVEAEILLAKALNKPRGWILAHGDHQLSKPELLVYSRLLNRRLKSEPLAYILGEQEFYGLNFKVNKQVLIPRPETEQIVEQIANSLPAGKAGKQQTTNSIIIDVGTGSGAIIVSIASEIKKQKAKGKITNQKLKLFGLDISSKALTVAKQNAKLNGVDNDIIFLKGSLLQPLFTKNWKFKFGNCLETKNWKLKILSNLPYLKTTLPGLTKSQKYDLSFEPCLALLAGADGLKYYRQLAKQILKLKKSYPELEIELLAEIDPDQVKPMKKLFSFCKTFTVKKDFRNLNRLCIINI